LGAARVVTPMLQSSDKEVMLGLEAKAREDSGIGARY